MDKYGVLHEEFRRMWTNVFNMAHDEWVPRKRSLQPVFTKQRMTDYAGAMTEVAEEMAAEWARLGHLDVQPATRALTSEVLGRSLLGLSLGDRAAKLASDFEVFGDFLLDRIRRPVRLPLWFPTPGRSRYRAAMARLFSLCDEALAAARQDPAHHAPLIRQMLQTVDERTGRSLSEDALRADLLTFMLAGHDTTATTLAYALWQLGRHPDLQDDVAAEARSLGDRPLRPSDAGSLPRTMRVLQEALRLCPPAAAVARQARRDVVVDGFRVPRGWNLFVNTYALHRDPAMWEDADRFDPDRFSAERSAGRERWQYLPFGGGPRKCIGDHFAMLEATVVLATLVRALELRSEGEFEIAMGFTTHSATPVAMRVHAR